MWQKKVFWGRKSVKFFSSSKFWLPLNSHNKVTSCLWENGSLHMLKKSELNNGKKSWDDWEEGYNFCLNSWFGKRTQRVTFISSDRSSYSDGGLVCRDMHPHFFEILSISANILSFFFEDWMHIYWDAQISKRGCLRIYNI